MEISEFSSPTKALSGERISRFGRPQKQTILDMNSIPTEVAKFIPKSSPKRQRTKGDNVEVAIEENKSKEKISLPEDKENEVSTNIENICFKNIEIDEKVSADDISNQESNKAEQDTSEKELIIKQEDLSEDCILYGASKENHSDDEKSKQDYSDTDSALGSATSHENNNEIKVSEGELLIPGRILWGSFTKLSWFPCMAYPMDDSGNVLVGDKQVHVKYFNYNGFTAYLSIKNVFEYKDVHDFYEQITKMNIKKSKVKPFSKTCYKAMEEANFFMQYPIADRVQIFENILIHQDKQKLTNKSVVIERASDRKSVDSALGCTAPSFPSSPKSEILNTTDPIERYFLKMSQFNSFQDVSSVKERKSATSTSFKEIKAETSDEKANRRRSNRVVKKRKFNDFEDDFMDLRQDTKSPTPEKKPKRERLSKEETLEERFLIDVQTIHENLFRNLTKKRICMKCFTTNNEPTYRCTGKGTVKCSGWYHQSCCGSFEEKFEEIRHQTGDSDEIIQTKTLKSFLQCENCFEGVKNCSICNIPVELDDEAVTQICSNIECRLSFHKNCLKLWPQSKMGRASVKNCPQHTCHTCFSKEIHNTGNKLLKCVKCPSAYHMQVSCVPAGTKILSKTQIICPRHPNDKEMVKGQKDKQNRLNIINIDWCSICMENGKVICCDSCPSAFHIECINYVESDPDEKYICTECQEGRLPLYNTIVWARVGNYRWWPGLVMPAFILPEQIMKCQRSEREFCVRFFGSYDYYWFTCEKVFPYDGMNPYPKGGSSRLDNAFNAAIQEAQEMTKILETGYPQMDSKPKPYNKISQNKPIPPVKLKKLDEADNHGPCSCRETDQDPCGRSSNCLNMHLNVECNKGACPAKSACQNQKLRNKSYAELKIIKTQNRGFGAITLKDIPEDAFIIEYVGELIDTNEMNRRMIEKIKAKEKEFYFLTIEADLYVDAGPSGNLSRFINHSCEPNCITKKITVDGNTRIGIFSKETIKAGTELTFDYQMEFVGNKKDNCLCGSTKCSGLIGEKPTKEIEVKKKATKKRNSVAKIDGMKIVKKRRTSREVSDPLTKMLLNLVKDSSEFNK
ncbi:CLUMA_CG000004, isoform A [Clunio marinus]|uniref:CLUMA_CG000004, isoform A n=1 Tax=Clunio marinus TaxID=568069 RepID=A0A1J1HFR5_9DIPT|nr:CLUMA_CG000004, isoform A [Clunio marinus]